MTTAGRAPRARRTVSIQLWTGPSRYKKRLGDSDKAEGVPAVAVASEGTVETKFGGTIPLGHVSRPSSSSMRARRNASMRTCALLRMRL